MATVYLRPSSDAINLNYGGCGTPRERMALIAQVVAQELQRHDVITYTGQWNIDTATAVAQANLLQPNAYVSIGLGRGGGNRKGGRVYYRIPSEPLAQDLSESVDKITPTDLVQATEENYSRNRGAFYDLRNVTVPSAGVTVGFTDHKQDNSFVTQNSYELGVSIAEGILNYLNIAYKKPTDEQAEQMRMKYNNRKFA